MSKPKALRESDDWEEVPLFENLTDGRATTMEYAPPNWTRETWLILQWAVRSIPRDTDKHFTIGSVRSYLGIESHAALPALGTLVTYGLLTFDAYRAKWCATGKARSVFKAFGLEALRKTGTEAR